MDECAACGDLICAPMAARALWARCVGQRAAHGRLPRDIIDFTRTAALRIRVRAQVTVSAACATGGAPPPAAQVWHPTSGDVTVAALTTLESPAFPGQCLGLRGQSPSHAGATVLGLVNCSGAAQWRHDAATGELRTAAGLCVDIWSQNSE